VSEIAFGYRRRQSLCYYPQLGLVVLHFVAENGQLGDNVLTSCIKQLSSSVLSVLWFSPFEQLYSSASDRENKQTKNNTQ